MSISNWIVVGGPKAQSVMQTLDYVAELLQHLDWGMMFYFAQVNPTYQAVVRSEVRIRIRFILNNFIPYKHQSAFWRLIENTNACIFGGVVRSIMMAGDWTYYKVCPPQLDIIVPLDLANILSWNIFLRNMGYTKVTIPDCKEPFEYSTQSIQYFMQPGRYPTICLLHSAKPSPLWVGLQAPSTSSFVFLTARAFYDFFPHLVDQKVTLTLTRTYTPKSPSFLFGFGLKSYEIDSPFYRNCPSICPVQWHTTDNLQETRVFTWDPERKDDIVALPIVQWTLGQDCSNHACPNSQIFRFLQDKIIFLTTNMPRWTVDSWSSYRERLLTMAGYVGRPFFLAFTLWGFYGRGSFSLIETTRQAPLPMFLVGKVSSETSKMNPYSVIQTASSADISPLFMFLECNVVEPTINAQFAEDFQTAHKHLTSLRSTLPIPPYLTTPSRSNHLQCLTLLSDTINFRLPLFERKIPWDDDDGNPNFEKLIFNCTLNSVLPALLKLQTDFQFNEVNLLDLRGQKMEITDYEKILGKTVEIVFLARESLDDRSLNVHVQSIHLLEE